MKASTWISEDLLLGSLDRCLVQGGGKLTEEGRKND